METKNMMNKHFGSGAKHPKPVLRIRIRDPVAFYPKDPGSGMIFFRIPDLGSRILTMSQIQDITFKNSEKQEKLNFV
jgi:hypothetical protein